MAIRVQVNVGREMLAEIDKYAEIMGVTRSALCSVLIGQGIMWYNGRLCPGAPCGDDQKFIPLDKQLSDASKRAAEENGWQALATAVRAFMAEEPENYEDDLQCPFEMVEKLNKAFNDFSEVLFKALATVATPEERAEELRRYNK